MLYKKPLEYEEELSSLKQELHTVAKLNSILDNRLKNYIINSVLEDEDIRLKEFLLQALKTKLQLQKKAPSIIKLDGERRDFYESTYPLICRLSQQLSLIVELASEFDGRSPEPNEPIEYGIFVLLEPILRYIDTTLENPKGIAHHKIVDFYYQSVIFREFLRLSPENRSKMI